MWLLWHVCASSLGPWLMEMQKYFVPVSSGLHRQQEEYDGTLHPEEPVKRKAWNRRDIALLHVTGSR